MGNLQRSIVFRYTEYYVSLLLCWV